MLLINVDPIGLYLSYFGTIIKKSRGIKN